MVRGLASMLGGAVYRIPHYRYDGYVVYTNNPFGGAFRGFGSPQFTFAAESQLDMVAERLGMDSIELRLKNVSLPGDVTISGPRVTTCGTECIEQAVAASVTTRSTASATGAAWAWRRASTERQIPSISTPTLRLDRADQRGRLGDADRWLVEMGTGTGMRSMIARTRRRAGTSADLTTPTIGRRHHGSRVTTIGGNAVRLACQQAKQRLFAVAASWASAPISSRSAAGASL
jgi:putative selenate reductase molybdopterin-binding subunit